MSAAAARRPAAPRSRRPCATGRSPTARASSSLENHFNPTLALSGSLRAGPALRARRPAPDRVDDRRRAHEGDGAADEAPARRGPREPRREPLVLVGRVRSGRRRRLGRRALARRRSALRRARSRSCGPRSSRPTSSRRRRSASSGAIRQQQDQTSARAFEAAMRRIYPPAHPLHRLTGEERIARVEALRPRGPRGVLPRALRRGARSPSSSSATSTPSGLLDRLEAGSRLLGAGPGRRHPDPGPAARVPGLETVGWPTRRTPTSSSPARRTCSAPTRTTSPARSPTPRSASPR